MFNKSSQSRVSGKNRIFVLKNGEKHSIIISLCQTAARYGAERYYREESPGIKGQDNG